LRKTAFTLTLFFLVSIMSPNWVIAADNPVKESHTIGVRTYDGVVDTFEEIGPETSGETLEEFLDKAYWEWDTIAEITTIDGVPTKDTKYKKYAGYIDFKKKKPKPVRVTPQPKEPDIQVNINGVRWVDFPDQQPVKRNNRVLVPFRPLFENLKAKVTWDAPTQTVTAVRNGVTIILTIGSQTALKDDKEIQMDVAPEIINGRTMIPVRFVAEALGARVDWRGDRYVIIDIEE